MCHRLDDDSVSVDELIERCSKQIANTEVVLGNHVVWNEEWRSSVTFLSKMFGATSPYEFKINAIQEKLRFLGNEMERLKEREQMESTETMTANARSIVKKPLRSIADQVKLDDKFISHHDERVSIDQMGPYTFTLSNGKIVNEEGVKHFLQTHTRIKI